MTASSLEGRIPPEKSNWTEVDQIAWEEVKRKFPVGAELTGKILSRDVYGCYVDVGVPFPAVLLVPYLAGESPLRFPEDYPELGEEVRCRIRRYSDEDGARPGFIGLKAV